MLQLWNMRPCSILHLQDVVPCKAQLTQILRYEILQLVADAVSYVRMLCSASATSW